jgi:GntR family transcriptional regulator
MTDRASRTRLRRFRGQLAGEIADIIARELILSGETPPGELLKSEKELADLYEVSRPTIRESLLLLQQAGLLSIRHGVGSVVLPRPRSVTHGLDRLCSIETYAQEAGKAVETLDLEWNELEADEDLASKLEVPTGHAIVFIQRVKIYDGVRVGWLEDYIPEGVLPFDAFRSEFSGSALDVLLNHSEVGSEYADVDISAANLSPEIADRLAVDAGTAAVVLDGVLWTLDGRAANYARSYWLPEYFHFSIRRRHALGSRAGSDVSATASSSVPDDRAR